MIDLRRIVPKKAGNAVWWILMGAIVTAWFTTLNPTVAGFDAGYYFQAARDLAGGRNPYASGDFLYPPLAAWMLVPAVSALGQTHLALAFNVLIYTSVTALIAGSLVLAGLRPGIRRTPDFWLIPFLTAFCLLSPVIATATGLGNISPLVGALCVWAGVLNARGRPFAAAVLVAFATVLKIIPALLLVFMFWRAAGTRNRRMLLASITGAILAVAGILLPPGAADFIHGAGGATKWGIDIGGAAVSIHVWMARLFGRNALNHPEIATVVFAVGAVAASFIGFFRRDRAGVSWAVIMVCADIVSPKNCPHLFLSMCFPILAIFALHTAQTFGLDIKRDVIPGSTEVPGQRSTFTRFGSVMFALALPWIAASSEFFYFRGFPAGEILLPVIPLLLVILECWVLLRWESRMTRSVSR